MIRMLEIDRRSLFAAPMLNLQTGPRVTVVGAGAFGGWSALHLQRMGARVTLLDAWGPGNSRASSGGETRITRAAYPDRIYADLTVRALEIWKDHEKRWNQKVFFPCGVIRIQGKANTDAKKLLNVLRDAGVRHEQVPVKEAERKFPQFDFRGADWVLYEPNHGMLRARRGCELVLDAFRAAGGEYRQERADPAGRFDADAIVWACGPWLERLFPGVVKVKPTRQELFFFGVPAGETMYQETRMPCWIDDSIPASHYYGTPGNDWRGFKIGDDENGPEFDPENGERRVSEKQYTAIREYMKIRFPRMAGAPLVETRVCQYEVTPDAHLILDRHPSNAKFWLVGGGSGHGYKLGAAVGERVAQAVLGKREAPEMFRVARFRG
jgi:glycine/D-amino acid oxidase-like deaminating enzyme